MRLRGPDRRPAPSRERRLALRATCCGGDAAGRLERLRPATRQLDRFAIAEDELDRGPVKAELLTQPVLEIAPIREMDRGRVVGEEHERRWRNSRLGSVEDLRATALDDRRNLTFDGCSDDPVQFGRGDPLAPLAPDVDGHLQHPPDSLAGLRTDGDERGEIEERHLVVDPVDVLVERPIALVLDEVPFVDGDHEALALLDDIAGDMGVLSGEALDRVDDENGHIGPPDRPHRAERREALRGRSTGDLAAPLDTRRIDQNDLAATPREARVDRVTGGS